MIGFFDQVWGTTLPLQLVNDFSYHPKIYWVDAQQHEADFFF